MLLFSFSAGKANQLGGSNIENKTHKQPSGEAGPQYIKMSKKILIKNIIHMSRKNEIPFE